MDETSLQQFKIVRKLFEVIGIYPQQSKRLAPFNVRNVVALLFTFTMCISSFAFLLFEADNVHDFGASFYAAITEFAIIVSFLSIVFKMQNIFEIMDKIEGIIQKSKFNAYFVGKK